MWWNMFYRRSEPVGGVTPVYIGHTLDIQIEQQTNLDLSLEFNTVELSVDIQIEQE
jgi:hypothetical protein